MAGRRGFSLVELLVAMAVVGVLVGLLMPAVQYARESARQAQCKNNLHQLALGMLQHHDMHGFLPSGGWGTAWVGIPEQGFGRGQPGGWVYSVLPFTENAALHDLGRGLPSAQARRASAERLATPISYMNCPSRRTSACYPVLDHLEHLQDPRETDTVLCVARCDYAANAGDQSSSFLPGPDTLFDGFSSDYKWPPNHFYTGVTYLRSQVTIAGVVDGTSNTYLVGEKYVDQAQYVTGVDRGDDESMYTGFSPDVCRFSVNPPMEDEVGPSRMLRFGSAHPGGCQMAFCDGSVRLVSYSIDMYVHAEQANRTDTRNGR